MTVPPEAVKAGRAAAARVLPDLTSDLISAPLPMSRLLYNALQLACDEALDAAAPLIAAAERERVAVLAGQRNAHCCVAGGCQYSDGHLIAPFADLLREVPS